MYQYYTKLTHSFLWKQHLNSIYTTQRYVLVLYFLAGSYGSCHLPINQQPKYIAQTIVSCALNIFNHATAAHRCIALTAGVH